MSDGMTVGEVAQTVGVSVRTLHHWDHLGLVVPSARTWAGYRLYSRGDIARLQQVLVYRELGFSLARIQDLIEDPQADEHAHLIRQRSLLEDRIAHLQRMVRAVDSLMEEKKMTNELSPEEQARAFGSEWSDPYAEEAEQNWGDTPEWKESQRIRASMSKEDFAQAKREIEELDEQLAEAKRRGVEPGSDEANALADEHRENSLGRWMTMSPSKHVLIGRLYTDDPRYTAHYDDREPGLAAWLREVIEANAAAHGVDLESVTWE